MLSRIDNNGDYSPEYKEKLKEAHRFFKAHGYEFTEHGLNRAVSPKSGRRKHYYTLGEVLYTLKLPANYRDGETKVIKYYNRLAVIHGIDTGEVVDVMSLAKPTTRWERIFDGDQ